MTAIATTVDTASPEFQANQAAMHGLIEAGKLAYEVRDRHITDPAHMAVHATTYVADAVLDRIYADEDNGTKLWVVDAKTFKLIATVARLPHGAVVLPGLDTDLDEATWRLISGEPPRSAFWRIWRTGRRAPRRR